MLSIYCDELQTDWDQFLPYLAFAYNTSVHATTKVSPFKALYKREPRFPLEISMRTAIFIEARLEVTNLAFEIKTNFKRIINLVKKNS
jgi:hypothetical protein